MLLAVYCSLIDAGLEGGEGVVLVTVEVAFAPVSAEVGFAGVVLLLLLEFVDFARHFP